MSSQDISLLLEPISKEHPSGESIRYNAIYRQVHELRGAAISNPQPLGYKTIEEICENVLKHTSKDLHVAAILTEAWANLYGLYGLNSGLLLITGLCETFWESLHPDSSEDAEARLSTFIWVNDKLSDVVLKTPITHSKLPGMPIYTLADLVDARQLELVLQKAGSRKVEIMEQASKESRPTLENIAKSTLTTPMEFYVNLLHEIHELINTIESLEEFLDVQFGKEAITLKSFDMHLVQIETYAEEIFEQKKFKGDQSRDVLSVPKREEKVENNYSNLKDLSLEGLYELLSEVAERLEDIEPKSPAPKLVRKAVEWGNMSTSALLQELAKNDISIAEIAKILD